MRVADAGARGCEVRDTADRAAVAAQAVERRIVPEHRPAAVERVLLHLDDDLGLRRAGRRDRGNRVLSPNVQRIADHASVHRRVEQHVAVGVRVAGDEEPRAHRRGPVGAGGQLLAHRLQRPGADPAEVARVAEGHHGDSLLFGFFDTKLTGDILQRIGDHRRIETFMTTSSLTILFSMFNLVVFAIILAIYSLKILLENLLRHEDGVNVTRSDIEALCNWDPKASPDTEIAFTPSRVVLQDFTGVPAVVDLAAMRDAMTALGGNAEQINPLSPAELVIDHSVQVDGNTCINPRSPSRPMASVSNLLSTYA